MKKIYLFGTIALFLAACSSNDGFQGNESYQPNLTSSSDYAFVKGDSRIVIGGGETKSTRGAWVTTPQPEIPADAKKLEVGSWGGFYVYEGNEWWNNGGTLDANVTEYYVPAGESVHATNAQFNTLSSLTLYVAGDLIIDYFDNYPSKVTINILNGGSFNTNLSNGGTVSNDITKWETGMFQIPAGWTINVWGKFDTGYYPNISVTPGATLNYFEGAEDVVFGTEQTENYELWKNDANPVLSVSGTFYSEVPVRVKGNANFTGGTSTFYAGVHIDKNVTVKNDPSVPVVNIYECSYIDGQFSMTSNSEKATFNIYDYLYCGSMHCNSAAVYINLYDALLDVDNNFSTVSNDFYKNNLLVDKGAGIQIKGDTEGTYASIVRFLNNDLHIDKGNNYDVVEGTGVPTSFYVENTFSGNLVVLSEKVTIEYPKIAGQDDATEVITFKDGNVALNAENAYLPGKGECRPQIGEVPVTVIPPVHKYSATALDFGPNGELYLCWHSNIGNGEGGNGTNMYVTNEDGSSVSVDGINDWGGIIDVINTNNYGDPQTYLFDQTLIQNEHKYNHVVYYNGKLYLAGTSNKVGAALHEIELNADGTINESEFAEKNIRVNLTGSSANSSIINNGEIITISGFNNGGINKFALDDYSNQEQKAIYSSTEYTGKYLYNDGTYIIGLNDVNNGTVTLYDQNMNYVKSFNVGSLYPTDGKNVVVSDGNNIYVCRGNNGFEVYNREGQRVGGSKKSANGVDVDDKYIYVATGLGLVVLDKNETYNDGEVTYNKTVKRFTYTGTGNSRYNGIITTDASKQSANFVKVRNGKAYVAYGMYGLQIYDVSNLANN